MYYSFYWHNGYAVHGYAEVPTYAASHGCVRTFIADQPRIYNELNYGESIFVF
jgi:lipoprotein-anchoring transpeptidase ErfK/SrfK